MRLFRQKHPGALYKKPFLLFSLAALSSVTLLTGCHGAKDQSAFTIPGEFDTSRDYEITFWAKNDTNKTQTEIYKKAISDFEALYPNITVDLQRCNHQHRHRHHSERMYHLPGPYCHLPYGKRYRCPSGRSDGRFQLRTWR